MYIPFVCVRGVILIGAASEPGMVAPINGMSYHSRSGKNANSALVVEVKCGDFFSNHPLAGVEYQQYWEKKLILWLDADFLPRYKLWVIFKMIG